MGRAPCCHKVGLRRGPWSSKEDALLSDYIRQNGEGQWKSLPKKAGLLRCGKSCRLRWMNYLRPGIKRGNISQEEEDLIVRLHRLLGNRWSLIAGRLPGRTDNEIKNYWNTHILKKLEKAARAPPPPSVTTKSKKYKRKKAGAEEEEEPPKIKVYAPKAIRVTAKFFNADAGCDALGSGLSSSSDAGDPAAPAAVGSERSFSWSPLLDITDLPFDNELFDTLPGIYPLEPSPWPAATLAWPPFPVPL